MTSRSGATWVAMLLAVLVLPAACSRGDGGRAKAEAEFTQQLVDGGLDPTVAECVVEKFFDGRTNDELNDFFLRAELTNEERAEFASLTKKCIPAVTG
ncbi:MAG: hypothetical protein H6513_07350 [Acidimicrobiaceae bacterium]|nr:hypothetical protein [Ilumatobacter sp.]MCB9380494.1 hypothetical protein [Acidimicrobiaceae bacterium]MCO5329607.1 hypothetical protein [Ilumatobacteraceae bacterium]